MQQSKSEQQITQQNSIADTKSIETGTKKTVLDESKNNDETVTKTIIYDTDKPVLIATGKPPVKSETIVTNKKAEKKDVKIVVDSAKKDVATHLDKTKTDAQVKEQTKTVEKTKPTIKYYFYIIGLLVFIVLGYLGFKNLDR